MKLFYNFIATMDSANVLLLPGLNPGENKKTDEIHVNTLHKADNVTFPGSMMPNEENCNCNFHCADGHSKMLGMVCEFR